jgi:hypothetical protein
VTERRRWSVQVDGVSSAIAMEPTFLDRLKERQIELDRLDREARCDPTGLGIYGGEETIDEIVRRQNRR